ncbi:MAG: nucleoside-diphosphate sugar epimerase/dehydratase [Immundisolibacteraceae bacterium]|nr:nucleoside-diphosphate sugar epimerase/dehydratase [Immundisolibacteraceae bacterium]
MSRSRGRWARLLAFVHDALWIAPAILIAYAARFNLEWRVAEMSYDLRYLVPVALVSHSTSFWVFGLYRGVWRFASVPDLVRILKSVVVGAAFTVFGALAFNRLEGVPRTVLVLYPLFLALGLSVPRLLYRWFKDHRLGLSGGEQPRALIVGAGTAGELLVRDLLRGKQYLPVGLLDDDGYKQGSEIHNVRVMGRIRNLPKIADKTQADLVLLAMPGAPHMVRQAVIAFCDEAQLPCKTLPSVDDLHDAADLGARLRSVEIEDLLGRDQVVLDEGMLQSFLQGKRVLVTGAGGSIGSELCRQILRFSPATLVALDNGEFNLYQIDREIITRVSKPQQWLPQLGDVRDTEYLEKLFLNYQPQVVFHAAAYKHVPLLETNEAQAVANNVLGTWNVLQAALRHSSERFVLVSTDKAVSPGNVMGATKRVAELICQTAQESAVKTEVITTRFGNVLGSAGSVVPLFRQQIAAGGPVTVTDAEMTRFFMTIPEAASLVLQAGAQGEGGQIYVLQMGAAVKIIDLARQMIRLAGFVPEEEIAIKFTGLRPGEKMHESLFYPDETPVGTAHGKILRAAGTRYDRVAIEDCLTALRAGLGSQAVAESVAILRQALADLVPSLPVTREQPEIEDASAAGVVVRLSAVSGGVAEN